MKPPTACETNEKLGIFLQAKWWKQKLETSREKGVNWLREEKTIQDDASGKKMGI